jgi:hypothetical protein
MKWVLKQYVITETQVWKIDSRSRPRGDLGIKVRSLRELWLISFLNRGKDNQNRLNDEMFQHRVGSLKKKELSTCL